MAKRGLSDASPDEPHYLGHRERLRERFREGANALPDYELLELALFSAIRREDTKELAKRLLAEFNGDLTALFSASRERLKQIDGVGDAAADQVAIISSFVTRAAKQPVTKREVLSSWNAVVNYCTQKMAGHSNEQFHILFLDRKNQLIKDEVQSHGTVDHTPVYPREVIRRALELGASSIILAHNHPSGDATPSASDVNMTKQIVEAARALEIAVHDHIVVGRNGCKSLKQLGLM